MLIFPPNPYVEILTSNGMVLIGRTFGMQLGHEDGALMKGIGALIKGAAKSSINLFPIRKIHVAVSNLQPKRGCTPEPAGTLIWGFVSRTVGKK